MVDYEYTPLYYGEITQVRFYDTNSATWKGGLCYQNKLVDGATGQEYLIEEIVARAQSHNINFEDAIVELDWNNLNEPILK